MKNLYLTKIDPKQCLKKRQDVNTHCTPNVHIMNDIMLNIKAFYPLIIIFLLVSCKQQPTIEGVFVYSGVDKTVNSGLPESACSMVDEFEFRDGRCYYKMGMEMRVKYVMDEGMIYLNPDGVGLSFHIIDKNTLRLDQCLFKLKND